MTPHDPTDGRVAQYVLHDALRVAFSEWLTSRGLEAVLFEDDPDCVRPTWCLRADLVLDPAGMCACGHAMRSHSLWFNATLGGMTLACSMGSCACAILTSSGR